LRLHGVHTWACCQMTAKNIQSSVIVTHQFWKYSEECRELSGLNFLPVKDQETLWTSLIMAAQIPWRVMAVMFHDGSIWTFCYLSSPFFALQNVNLSAFFWLYWSWDVMSAGRYIPYRDWHLILSSLALPDSTRAKLLYIATLLSKFAVWCILFTAKFSSCDV
jgi:hypothetical protein